MTQIYAEDPNAVAAMPPETDPLKDTQTILASPNTTVGLAPVLADAAAGVEEYGPAPLIAQAAQSSNFNPRGNFNPLSLEDERLLRFGTADFAAQSDASLEGLYDSYDRIGAISDRRNEELQESLVRFLDVGVNEFKGAIKLPPIANPVVGWAANKLFTEGKNAVFKPLEEALDQRISSLSTHPERAFEGIDKSIDALEKQTGAIEKVQIEAQRILQSRRDGAELSQEDQTTLAEAREVFRNYYGSDFQSGTSAATFDTVRESYYRQHWRVTNYVAANEKIAQVEAEGFRRDAAAVAGGDFDNPQLNQENYSEFHVNRRMAEGAEESARVWRERYSETIEASRQSKDSFVEAERQHYETMSVTHDIWQQIDAEIGY